MTADEHGRRHEALRITGELNGGCHEPQRVRDLLAQLTGKRVFIAVIGAASVVTRDVPARAIVVGSPAKFVRSVSD